MLNKQPIDLMFICASGYFVEHCLDEQCPPYPLQNTSNCCTMMSCQTLAEDVACSDNVRRCFAVGNEEFTGTARCHWCCRRTYFYRPDFTPSQLLIICFDPSYELVPHSLDTAMFWLEAEISLRDQNRTMWKGVQPFNRDLIKASQRWYADSS